MTTAVYGGVRAPRARGGLTAPEIRARKGGPPLAMLTAYDYPTARALDGAGLDLVLVGDSLAEVELGYETTRAATLEVMCHHTRAVRRGLAATHLVADLPADTYRTPAEAAKSAAALVDAGADSVKLEGPLAPQVRAIVGAGIPVMGHVGLLPQTAEERCRQGRTPEDADRLVAGARELDRAGVYALVVEAVVPGVTGRITAAVSCPTIGIAAGDGCDGQVLVIHDLVGLNPSPPPFVRPAADVFGTIRDAARAFAAAARGTA